MENLLAEYDVSREKAAADVDKFIQKAKDADVLE
nr:PqqD family peptide modification chaperone [uncultured Ruminococcus sp.]